MKALALVLMASLVPAVAAAAEPACDQDSSCSPYAQHKFARTLVGFGLVPELPTSVHAALTAEFGGRPFSGAPPNVGALSTGVGFSSATDLTGRFALIGLGLFVKEDLTKLFVSGLWQTNPPSQFPFRLQLGARLGFALSDSFRDVPHTPHFVLIRAENQIFLDLEIPVGAPRVHSIVVRSAWDTPVNGPALFRWGLLFGLDYGWTNG